MTPRRHTTTARRQSARAQGRPFIGLKIPFVGRQYPSVIPSVGKDSPFIGIKRYSGFTIIELMITLIVAGIIAAWAMPNFMRMIDNQRIKTQTSDLVVVLQTARSESVKIKRPVTICASNFATTSGNSCSASLTDWHLGWIMWADRNNSGGLNDTDLEVIQAAVAAPGKVEIGLRLSTEAAEAATLDTFQFLPNGATNNAATIVFDICDDRQANVGRTITLGATGRPVVDANTDCTN